MYKSKLQVMCHKKSWSMPKYSTVKDGPDHNPCFTGTVIVKGIPFSTTHSSPNSKDAQNKAAKLAFEHLCAAPHCVPDLDNTALNKSLLQEFVQRDQPKYVTKNSSPPHMPTFVLTVEVRGRTFEGQAAKTKKLAEAHAAKVAYFSLQDGNLVDAVLSSGSQVIKALGASSSILQPVIIGDSPQRVGPNTNELLELESVRQQITKSW